VRRLSWLDHVERIESERAPKCFLNGEFAEEEDLGTRRSKM
jgi:hypothetical protein